MAETIFAKNVVTDDAGREWPLHSHTSRDQCEVLQTIIREIRPKVSLEVGLGYGISTLNICQAMKEVGGVKHIVMDPFQEKFREIGLRNIRLAGYEQLVDFRRQMAHEVLPELLREGVKVDFAYLDGSKVFDFVLVNIFYISRLLPIGGVMVLDDCDFPGIRKVCQFLVRHPSFDIAGAWGAHPRKVKNRLLHAIINRVPRAEMMFSGDLIDTSPHLKGRPHWMAFRKKAEDERSWDWYEQF